MNDKDKEAFEKWFLEYPSWRVTMSRQESCGKAWQAACQYKQQEINELNSRLAEASDIIQEIVDSDEDRYNRPRYYSRCKEFLV